ncbi:hypothetical protein PGIGA_G00197410, partial [Pangasianodon gigas]|nr:hypothetical protein [Pangasianodon gigas]
MWVCLSLIILNSFLIISITYRCPVFSFPPLLVFSCASGCQIGTVCPLHLQELKLVRLECEGVAQKHKQVTNETAPLKGVAEML